MTVASPCRFADRHQTPSAPNEATDETPRDQIDLGPVEEVKWVPVPFIELAKDVDLMIHECTFPESAIEFRKKANIGTWSHTSPTELGKLAKAAAKGKAGAG